MAFYSSYFHNILQSYKNVRLKSLCKVRLWQVILCDKLDHKEQRSETMKRIFTKEDKKTKSKRYRAIN